MQQAGWKLGRVPWYGATFVGGFFPEWDERPRPRMDFGPNRNQTELFVGESNRPDRGEWFKK
jgi:hypothetical protein